MIQNNQKFNVLETIVDLMNDPKFRTLFETNCNCTSDIETMILAMRTYQFIEKIYYDKYQSYPTKTYMYEGIKKILGNSDIRKFLVKNTKFIIDERRDFERLLISNNLLTSVASEDNKFINL